MTAPGKSGPAWIAIAVLAAHALATNAAPVITMSVGPNETLTYPSNMQSLPDEHTTIFPPAAGSSAYRFFAASSLTGGNSGTVVLETTDLLTFKVADGFPAQVMTAPVHLRQCNPALDTEFDENYAAQGSVVQDPTLPPGNLIMIYEAENHCPGGIPQFPFYATVGFARSSDGGKTWPAPANAEFGGTDRYPVLKVSTPEASVPADVAIGDAIPSAIVDGNYLYIAYLELPAPGSPAAGGNFRVARGLLGGSGPVMFSKWNNGSFSSPGIGGATSPVLPAGGCIGGQGMPSIYNVDSLGIYVLTYVCRNLQTGQAGWYFATATSLELQDWTVPQLIENSESVLYAPCPGQTSSDGQQFNGWFQSLMSPGVASGHIAQAGFAFMGTGCDTGTRSFARRTFAIKAGANAPTIDQHGLTGSWFRPATSGQGVEIEVFPDFVANGTGYLQGSWLTFDTAAGGADHNRWYTFDGSAQSGNSAAVLTLYQNTGGNFDAPPATQAMPVGHASLSFADCTNGLLTYTFTDGTARSGTMPLTRLMPDVECAPSASPAASSDFGLSGNWYDVETPGQGLVVEVNPIARSLFFTWSTYAVNAQAAGAAGQRWYTGQASYTPGARSIPFSLFETTGGLFNQSSPLPNTVDINTGLLVFTSCSTATLTIPFRETIPLTRLGPAPASCAF
jgi:hypothetical protein